MLIAIIVLIGIFAWLGCAGFGTYFLISRHKAKKKGISNWAYKQKVNIQ